MGIFFTIAGGLVSFLSGVGVSLSKIGADAPFQVASQEAVNGIVFAALFLAIIFILVGCLGNLARALFSMTAHTIRSREPQFFNVRQSEANMLFSFFELDAFGRVLSVKDEGQ
ncbi:MULTISPECIES: hypothetical protein [unclassified Ruegeria]|uniref:hypothetical protein n=1 Tax=unclassified Ruegeria TaxID=2625375 RepID=UPI00148804BE|nr:MULTISPECIES: hypothetical protein [unclassified Ruegeria]NOD35483.1 hypothetical protein [Ruegeria sp. HKCCD7296]NOE35566.1 hypothetical protein [Ruegeria sp. HKCCD7318]NOE43158.1 hypothetical protein [Ruegeria sp. HKCCD7319]